MVNVVHDLLENEWLTTCKNMGEVALVKDGKSRWQSPLG